MKYLIVIILLLPLPAYAANTVVYDDAPQTVTDKIIEVRTGTAADLSAVTGMTDGFKFTVTDGANLTDCVTGGSNHKVECCYDETEVEWEVCYPGVNQARVPVVTGTVASFAGKGLAVGSNGVSIDLKLDAYTSDPCGTYPARIPWYNDTADIPCICDDNGDDIKYDGTACF